MPDLEPDAGLKFSDLLFASRKCVACSYICDDSVNFCGLPVILPALSPRAPDNILLILLLNRVDL